MLCFDLHLSIGLGSTVHFRASCEWSPKHPNKQVQRTWVMWEWPLSNEQRFESSMYNCNIRHIQYKIFQWETSKVIFQGWNIQIWFKYLYQSSWQHCPKNNLISSIVYIVYITLSKIVNNQFPKPPVIHPTFIWWQTISYQWYTMPYWDFGSEVWPDPDKLSSSGLKFTVWIRGLIWFVLGVGFWFGTMIWVRGWIWFD